MDVRLLSVLAGCGLAAVVVTAGRYVLTDGAALLDDPAAASGCVRPIRAGRLAPIA